MLTRADAFPPDMQGALLSRAIELSEARSSERLHLRHRAGFRALGLGDYHQSAIEFEALIEEFASDLDARIIVGSARFYLGQARLGIGDISAAIEVYRRLSLSDGPWSRLGAQCVVESLIEGRKFAEARLVLQDQKVALTHAHRAAFSDVIGLLERRPLHPTEERLEAILALPPESQPLEALIAAAAMLIQHRSFSRALELLREATVRDHNTGRRITWRKALLKRLVSECPS